MDLIETLARVEHESSGYHKQRYGHNKKAKAWSMKVAQAMLEAIQAGSQDDLVERVARAGYETRYGGNTAARSAFEACFGKITVRPFGPHDPAYPIWAQKATDVIAAYRKAVEDESKAGE